MSDTPDRVQKILVEVLGAKACEAGRETRLKEDLGADALEVVEIIMATEEEFSVDIPDDDAGDVRNGRRAGGRGGEV